MKRIVKKRTVPCIKLKIKRITVLDTLDVESAADILALPVKKNYKIDTQFR